MWIVRLALRRPLSMAVMALLMLVLGVLSSLEPLNSPGRPQSLLVASAQVRPGSACRLQYCPAPFELDGQDRRHRGDVGLRRWRRD